MKALLGLSLLILGTSPSALAVVGVTHSPIYPTETDVVVVTSTVSCLGPTTIDDRTVTRRANAIDIAVKVSCGPFSPGGEVHDAVQLGKLAAGHYTLRLSAMYREEPSSPYSAAFELGSRSFKVLPSQQVEDLSAFFRFPFKSAAESPILIKASDVNVFEPLRWLTDVDPWLGPISSLLLDNSFQGPRPVLEMAALQLAANPASAATLLLRAENGRFFKRREYFPPIAIPAAEPSRALTTTVVRSVSDLLDTRHTAVRHGPVRRNYYGVEFDAIAVTVYVGAYSCREYLFALNVGLVGIPSTSCDLPLSFVPVSFPLPKQNGTVIEFVNTADFPDETGGHFFYATNIAEVAQLDRGLQGQFRRTGRTFAAGGYVRVCRFYGSTDPGPNSHFFTADALECDALKAAQKVPRPGVEQQWNYEGLAFDVVPSARNVPHCATGLQPVHRVYNNAFAQGSRRGSSNHRYTTNAAGEIAEMTALGWVDEGVAFCVPRS